VILPRRLQEDLDADGIIIGFVSRISLPSAVSTSMQQCLFHHPGSCTIPLDSVQGGFVLVFAIP
jgi:hypothetical protein